MDQYDKYDYIIKSRKFKNKTKVSYSYQPKIKKAKRIKHIRNIKLINSLKLNKIRKDLIKYIDQNRKEKYIIKTKYESPFQCNCSLDRAGYCNCYCRLDCDSCNCGKYWYDEYDLVFCEFKSTFEKTLKTLKKSKSFDPGFSKPELAIELELELESKSIKQKSIKQKSIEQELKKSDLIEFFCKTLPRFFKINIYGDAVMSMISGIDSDYIDTMVYDFNELKRFMLMMDRLIGPYDRDKLSYVAYTDHWDRGVIRNCQSFRRYVLRDNICDIQSIICNIDNIEIRFNVNMRMRYGVEDWHPYLGFLETQIMFGKVSDLYDHSSAARIGDPDKICFNMFYNNKNKDYRKNNANNNGNNNFDSIKQNLINKKLTINKNIGDVFIGSLVRSNIKIIKCYYEKIARGYTIPDPCPVAANLFFWYTFDQFDDTVYSATKMNRNVIHCIYQFLKINTTNICTYCKERFNKSGKYESFAISPACKCGKMKYIRGGVSSDDGPEIDESDRYAYHHRGEFYDYCGKMKNPNNMFHLDCFSKIACELFN